MKITQYKDYGIYARRGSSKVYVRFEGKLITFPTELAAKQAITRWLYLTGQEGRK